MVSAPAVPMEITVNDIASRISDSKDGPVLSLGLLVKIPITELLNALACFQGLPRKHEELPAKDDDAFLSVSSIEQVLANLKEELAESTRSSVEALRKSLDRNSNHTLQKFEKTSDVPESPQGGLGRDMPNHRIYSSRPLRVPELPSSRKCMPQWCQKCQKHHHRDPMVQPQSSTQFRASAPPFAPNPAQAVLAKAASWSSIRAGNDSVDDSQRSQVVVTFPTMDASQPSPSSLCKPTLQDKTTSNEVALDYAELEEID